MSRAPAIDERAWALHVWRSPDGNTHPQWTALGDPRLCRCGERHRLADAPARLICPGVAHTEYSRPCVLCGLGWRVPWPDVILDVWSPGPDLKSIAGPYVMEEGGGIRLSGLTRMQVIGAPDEAVIQQGQLNVSLDDLDAASLTYRYGRICPGRIIDNPDGL